MADSDQTTEAAKPAPATAAGRPPSAWRSRLIAVGCLVAAAIAQWVLVNIPSGAIKEDVGVPAHAEQVTFNLPTTGNGSPLSFYYTPESFTKRVFVEAYFDNAQLSAETLNKLKLWQISAPSSLALIKYRAAGSGKSACATTVSVEPDAGRPTAVTFSQSESDADGSRSVGTVFQGASAMVTLLSQGGAGGLSTCRVEVAVADWTQAMQGDLPVKILVPAGSGFRLHWYNEDDSSGPWEKNDLLQFGLARSSGFSAKQVLVVPQGGAPQAANFDARGGNDSPLAVSSFKIEQSQLEISVEGTGVLHKDGKVASNTNIFQAISKYPLLAAMLGAANLALLGWVKKVCFPARQASAEKSASS